MKNDPSRRSTLKGFGCLGAMSLVTPAGLMGENLPVASVAEKSGVTEIRRRIFQQVRQTLFIDTHEHLIEEIDRMPGTTYSRIKVDDWSLLMSHYLNSDMLTAGMPKESWDRFFSAKMDPIDKWKLLEPYWPAVKNTGYGQAVNLAIKHLYNVEQLSAKTVRQVQLGYEQTRRPGFYKDILQNRAGIESCQVNSLQKPIEHTAMPTLLMQDLSIVGMFSGPNFKTFGDPTGITVACLEDWHRVIDWWFEKYGRLAIAVKSQNAYSRDIDYHQVPIEESENIFKKKLEGQALTEAENKMLEDHLFWYAVQKATQHQLPIKLHTGYYAGQDKMPLSRLSKNPASACELCRLGPATTFVFMHLGYPYYEEMIAVAKQFTNAYIDMCWSWIINPLAAKDFLKKYLVTAPANKILTFGGDYYIVEPVLGHALIARQGISLALSELVEEGWMPLDNALELVEPIMRGNAKKLFRLEEKTKLLSSVKWF